MYSDFYINLTRMKNLNNAAQLEAIKQMYLLSDELENPCPDCGYFDQCDCKTQIGQIERPNKRTIVIPTTKGTLRVTLLDKDKAVVEASPCGTPEMYQVVGTVPTSTGLNAAIEMAENALADDQLMESMFESMKGKAAAAALAGALATGCAGGPHYGAEVDPVIQDEQAPKEIVVNPGDTISGDDFINLVKDYSYKIRHDDSTMAASLDKGESAKEANKIYNLLKSGSVKVGSYSPEMSANQFKAALTHELHGTLGLDYDEFLKDDPTYTR